MLMKLKELQQLAHKPRSLTRNENPPKTGKKTLDSACHTKKKCETKPFLKCMPNLKIKNVTGNIEKDGGFVWYFKQNLQQQTTFRLRDA